MTLHFEKLVVVGLGLLGGSVALAARRCGVAARVVSTGRRPEGHRAAVERGVVDASGPFDEAVPGADLVVLSSPVFAMPEMTRRVAPHLAAGALVTDVGSVKGALAETLPGLLPPGVEYVGAHPMAGSHLHGLDHAAPDLFDGAPCVVTPTPDSSAEAVARVSGFWRALGARVEIREPGVHDREVGWVSHVPHAVAFAFARALVDAPETAGELAGAGFRDFTRIAHSETEMWADILTANRKAVVGPLGQVTEDLVRLTRALEANDVEAVERFLASAREALEPISRRTKDQSIRTPNDGVKNPK